MKTITTFSIFLMMSCSTAHAQFNAQTVHDFLEAQTTVYQDGSEEDLDKFINYMADDIKDIHIAYGREFSGKEHFRKNMPIKAKALISYEKQISQIMLGTNVAIAIYHEQTKEKKRNGRISQYDGRSIIVIEFNDDDLITQMRRYQD